MAVSLRIDALDAVALHLCPEGVPAEVQLDVLLGPDDLLTVGTGDFAHDRAVLASHSDADLRAGVAAEHGAVLDERHLKAQSCRRECRRTACNPTADNHHVELPGRGRNLGQPEQSSPPCGHLLVGVFRRNELRVRREEQGITAAVEAGEISQFDLHPSLLDLDRAAILPDPALPLVPKGGRHFLAIDDYLESAGVVRRHPVLGPYPQPVRSGFGELDFGDGVGHRLPRPWARRYGDPITSRNCGSSTQPPWSAKPSASTSTSAAKAEIAISVTSRKARCLI